MQTQKHTRAEQARINGAKSRGPTTPQGKQKCRLASVKHGAYVAATSVLPGENPAKYQAVYDSLLDQYAPRNMAELCIVNSLADAIWRQRRLSDAANYEILRQMHFLGYDQPADQANYSAIHLAAENESSVVGRLEARMRHYTREIAWLQRILLYMQKCEVSDEASQMSAEILDLSVQRLEAEAKSAPPPPAKQPPHVETRPVEARQQLRE